MSGVDSAGLVEELRNTRTPGAEFLCLRAADALLAQAAELTEVLKDYRKEFKRGDAAESRALTATRQRDEALAALKASEEALADPIAVHINMMRGTIAKPSLENIHHLYPDIRGNAARMRHALRKVKHWAESRCPCHNEEPNPCPLCGASVENLEACKSAENTMPRDVLQAIRSALADATNNPPSDPGTEQREAGR